MDEIEYKLKTNNSVLVVNAVDKLISTIKSKFKPAERQRFVLENEELKVLREKCSSKDAIVSLTACQGLLALVELGVLEIAHTMSTVVTLLPSAHNYSAIISTMTGLLILDLKSRLAPGTEYKCQFSVKSPQHPFITVLERNKDAEDDIFAQMQALCTHTDNLVSSNSLELLRPVFFYLTCNPHRESSIRPWQLLLSLPSSGPRCRLLLACLSRQQICNPTLIERSFSAYRAVTDAAIYMKDEQYITALLPVLARISSELVKHGRDPRPCYNLIERCISLQSARLRPSIGVTVHILADNLPIAPALYLHDTFNLCLNIISKYDCPSISLNAFVARSLQWLHLPSFLTTSALKIASKILDIYREGTKQDNSLNIPNLMSNKIFQTLIHSDSYLSVTVKIHSVWERLRDDKIQLEKWLNGIENIHDTVKVELLPLFYGIMMEKNRDMEDVVLKVLKIVIGLLDFKKEVAVELLPILVYKLANDESPAIRLECLKALPLMAKIKENVPSIVSILNKFKANKGQPTPVLIMLYTTLAEIQVRCFPYLQEILVESGPGRPDDLKWEVDIAKILAVKRMCELRASSHGLELVSIISTTLNRCSDKSGSVATCIALASIALLWRSAALSPVSAWRALQPKLDKDSRPVVQMYICALLWELPPLQSTETISGACAALWRYLAEGVPCVVDAACTALANFSLDSYVLKDIPEIYRKTIKLPSAYCKTPADAARKPEDVLDYIPCEIWPEVFKYTNQSSLRGVSTLARKHIEREIKSFRSGMYQFSGQEPTNLSALPAKSVLRGVFDGFRKQIISPSHECSEEATLAMLSALCVTSRPLPPADVHFLCSVTSRGLGWRRGALSLVATQGKVSPSAKAVIEDWLHTIQTGPADESDVILFYELLPTLTKTLSPNTLRGPLERTLADSFSLISQTKTKLNYPQFILQQTLNKLNEKERKIDDFFKVEDVFDMYNVKESVCLFESELLLIKKCLDSDIHDANRSLLAQLVEHYFALISDDNVTWPTFVQTCTSLPTSYIERMTSPSGWWEPSVTLLRKAVAVRSALACMGEDGLVWLTEVIDAQAKEYTDQESSLYTMFPAFLSRPLDSKTSVWFLQLLARTQVAFNESDDPASHRYLFSIFSLAVCAWSGLWAIEGAPPPCRPPPLLHAAVTALLLRDGAEPYARQLLEWLSHSREVTPVQEASSCSRALLCAAQLPAATSHNIWMRLESFDKEIAEEA